MVYHKNHKYKYNNEISTFIHANLGLNKLITIQVENPNDAHDL